MKKLFLIFCVLTISVSPLLSKTITKGTLKTLPNGITIVNYKAENSVPFSQPCGGWDEVSRSFEVDWPVSAPELKQDILILYRLAVLKFLNDGVKRDYLPVNINFEDVLDDLLKIDATLDENGAYFDDYVFQEVKIAISVNDNIAIIKEDRNETYTFQQEDPESSDYIAISDSGHVLDYSLFPPMEEFKPLLFKYLTNWDNPVKKPEKEFNNIDYPEKLPLITNDYVEFNWGYSGMGMPFLNAKIPLSEFRELASIALLEFLP